MILPNPNFPSNTSTPSTLANLADIDSRLAGADDLIRNFAEECARKLREFDNTHIKIGLIGASGSGKSSLINAIAQSRIAAVGFTETTDAPQSFLYQGLELVDLPGCGTQKFPIETYVQDLNLASYDCFILVTAQRFYQNDLHLIHALKSISKPVYVVRNMIDKAIEDAKHDNGMSEPEVKKVIQDDLFRQLPSPKPRRVYLTSARQPTSHDLGQLLNDIAANLAGIKKNRFIADMAAYNDDALAQKRKLAQDLVSSYAGLAALNGLNPLPLADVIADVTLLLKLSKQISHIFGLTDQNQTYFKRCLNAKAMPSILSKCAQFSAKYLVRSALIKHIASRGFAKQASKFIPFAGHAFACCLGYRTTQMLGQQLITEAEALAREILQQFIEQAHSAH